MSKFKFIIAVGPKAPKGKNLLRGAIDSALDTAKTFVTTAAIPKMRTITVPIPSAACEFLKNDEMKKPIAKNTSPCAKSPTNINNISVKILLITTVSVLKAKEIPKVTAPKIK